MGDIMNTSGYDFHELLRFNKWNRRLLNLYWIFNVIVLITEITLFFVIDKYGALFFPAKYHLFHFILIPTVIMLGITGLCEVAVFLFKEKYKWILPYVMTFTSVTYCSVVLAVHNIVVVLCVTFIIPIIISLVYDNKNVLRVTFIFSITGLITVCTVVMNFNLPEYQYLDLSSIITTIVILIAVYLLCGTVLNRNKEIIDTLVNAEHSAYELEIAKNHAQAEANARTRFLANMSHEIRTPMNGIIGLTGLALDDNELSEKQREYLSKINRSAEGLLVIVNDILDISKIDAGEYKSEKIPFKLHDILNECKVSLVHDANKKELAFRIIDETNLIEPIIGDSTRLRQALLNFLSNAVKFTKQGSVTLTVKREAVSKGMISVYFEIADTGIGITKEQLTMIFKPFKQADESTTRKFGGTGLGLPIAKSIIEMMGGEVYAESTLGVGSKFSFVLSFPIADNEDVKLKALQYTDSYRPIFEGRVLVCEDNEINRQVAVESLEKLGFSVVVAENGKVGIDIVDELGPFDIILLDIHMPVMDGFAAAKEFRNRGINTPLIAVTADAMPADKEKCLKSGMVDYISKPFKLRDLWVCLSKYINPIGESIINEIGDNSHYKDNKVIDMKLGIENSAGSQELHKKMMVRFAERNRDVYNQIEKMIEDKDYEAVKRIAHKEKGVALIIGAVRLAECLTELERICEAEVIPCEVLEEYSRELDNVLEYIR